MGSKGPVSHTVPGYASEQSVHLRLQHRPLLVLLTTPVPGHASRLVHRQRRGHEQHQQGGTGVGHELDPQPAEIGIPECLGIGYRRELATLPSPQAAWRICTLESPSQDERD